MPPSFICHGKEELAKWLGFRKRCYSMDGHLAMFVLHLKLYHTAWNAMYESFLATGGTQLQYCHLGACSVLQKEQTYSKRKVYNRNMDVCTDI